MSSILNLRRSLSKRMSSNMSNSQQATKIRQEVQELTANDPDLTRESRSLSTSEEEHREESGAGTTTPTATSASAVNFVPLGMGGNGRTHVVTNASAQLIHNDNVTLEDLERMTNLFYEKAFADATLDTFIRSRDDPHGARFAKWIHQKLSGSTVWDQDRRQRSTEPVRLAGGHHHVVHDRSSAHVAAWYSPKRPTREVGRHFKLDECRVWMRLHFWAMRESGLMESAPSFCDYYVRFIGHFVRVYEGLAPVFARESLRWSGNQENIDRYLENGRRMSDVLGLSLEEAEAQIPEDEANDAEWPYNQTPRRG